MALARHHEGQVLSQVHPALQTLLLTCTVGTRELLSQRDKHVPNAGSGPQPPAQKEAPGFLSHSPCGCHCWERGSTSRADEPEIDPGDTILRLDSPGGAAQGQVVEPSADGFPSETLTLSHRSFRASTGRGLQVCIPPTSPLPAAAPSSQRPSLHVPSTPGPTDAQKGSTRAPSPQSACQPWRAPPKAPQTGIPHVPNSCAKHCSGEVCFWGWEAPRGQRNCPSSHWHPRDRPTEPWQEMG